MTALVQRFDARAWILFAAMALLWGIPYLFIKVAVDSYSPAAVVAGRTLLGALLLLPFALRQRSLRPAFGKIGWVLAFGAIEMAGPFLLLGHAEQTLPSGLTGLLVATVPLFAAVIALGGGDRSVLRPSRAIGLFVGFIGVAIVVIGPGLAVEGGGGLIAIGEVLLVALCYAIAPFIIARVGPVRAPLFTYVNPVVAIVLGAIILGEEITLGLIIGFPLVIFGCWLAATGGTLRVRPPVDELPPVAPG